MEPGGCRSTYAREALHGCHGNAPACLSHWRQLPLPAAKSYTTASFSTWMVHLLWLVMLCSAWVHRQACQLQRLASLGAGTLTQAHIDFADMRARTGKIEEGCSCVCFAHCWIWWLHECCELSRVGDICQIMHVRRSTHLRAPREGNTSVPQGPSVALGARHNESH